MRRRKSNSFAQLGTLFMALVIALMLSGMGYGVWSDTISIIGSAETGKWNVRLSDPDPTSGTMILSTADNVLTVTLASAEANKTYYGSFKANNDGTVPVKITSITPSGVPTGVTNISFGGVIAGTVIEAGDTVDGTIEVTTGDPPPADGSFTETFDFIPWN